MSQRLFFFIALLTILIGLFGLTGVIRFNQTTAEEAPLPTFQVVQLQKALEKGESLERENIQYIRLSESEAMQNGIAQDTLLDIIPGMIALKGLNEGAYIFQRDFITPGEKGYIEAAIKPGMTPYSFRLKGRDFLGSGIAVGDYIDVLVLTSDEQNIGETGRSGSIQSFRTLSVSPLLYNVKILAIEGEENSADASLPITIELRRDQIGKMVIAKRIGIIEVVKSLTQNSSTAGLEADTHDVLPNFKSITEIRGQTKAYN